MFYSELSKLVLRVYWRQQSPSFSVLGFCPSKDPINNHSEKYGCFFVIFTLMKRILKRKVFQDLL
jgi:hypothetical protein